MIAPGLDPSARAARTPANGRLSPFQAAKHHFLREDDQIVHVAAGVRKLLKHGTLKTYKDYPHGMPTTHAETINADLLAFLKS